MKESKIKTWIKSHETELIVIGSTAVATVGAILLLNNWDAVTNLVTGTQKATPSKPLIVNTEVPAVTVITSEPIIKTSEVRMHQRNLPNGHHPSLGKVLEATARGIELTENQTIVSAHTRRYVA